MLLNRRLAIFLQIGFHCYLGPSKKKTLVYQYCIRSFFSLFNSILHSIIIANIRNKQNSPFWKCESWFSEALGKLPNITQCGVPVLGSKPRFAWLQSPCFFFSPPPWYHNWEAIEKVPSYTHLTQTLSIRRAGPMSWWPNMEAPFEENQLLPGPWLLKCLQFCHHRPCLMGVTAFKCSTPSG